MKFAALFVLKECVTLLFQLSDLEDILAVQLLRPVCLLMCLHGLSLSLSLSLTHTHTQTPVLGLVERLLPMSLSLPLLLNSCAISLLLCRPLLFVFSLSAELQLHLMHQTSIERITLASALLEGKQNKVRHGSPKEATLKPIGGNP